MPASNAISAATQIRVQFREINSYTHSVIARWSALPKSEHSKTEPNERAIAAPCKAPVAGETPVLSSPPNRRAAWQERQFRAALSAQVSATQALSNHLHHPQREARRLFHQPQ
jgi:hypothetical protein